MDFSGLLMVKIGWFPKGPVIDWQAAMMQVFQGNFASIHVTEGRLNDRGFCSALSYEAFSMKMERFKVETVMLQMVE